MDVNNGLLLCPNHDALFDSGLITFRDNGYIIISTEIEKSQYKLLNIDKNIKINITIDQIPYIKYHREKVFLDNKNNNEIEHKKIVDRIEILNK